MPINKDSNAGVLFPNIVRGVFVSLLMLFGVLCISFYPISSQDTDATRVTNISPVWSHDGSQIAFESSRSGNYDIWLYDFDANEISNVTSASESNEYSPVWLPDNETLMYVLETSDNSDIYSVNVHTLDRVNLTQTPTMREFAPAISQNGQYLAFVSQTQQRQDIVVLDLESNLSTNLTGNEETGHFGLPDWSHQDNSLVFTGDPFAEQTNLWMSIPAQYTLEEITTNGSDTLPVWSPTNPIVAMVSRRHGNLDIWLFDTEAEQYMNITSQNNRLDTSPSWSWDGKRLAYTAFSSKNEDIRSDIWIADLQTGEVRNATGAVTQAFLPAWSPVDDRIAFVSIDEGETNIWLMNADGTEARQLIR